MVDSRGDEVGGVDVMPYTQPSRAPESCCSPLCGYLEKRTVAGEHYDRCAHGIPMHEGCAWKRTPEQIKAIEAQEQMTAQRVREPFGRRGL